MTDNFDHALSSRLGQAVPVENTTVQMFTGSDIPEVSWHGRMIYRADTQTLQVYDSEYDGYLDVVGGVAGILTFVGPTVPVALHAGDLWFNTSDNRKLYRAAVVGADAITAGEWEPMGDERIDGVVTDVDNLTDDLAGLDTTVNARIDSEVATFQAGLATKSKHTLSSAAPGTTANNAGDVWERHNGDGVTIIGRWRGAGGTSWTAMNLSATYIPQLDIGTGTFGDLSGTRIVANSMGLEKLVVASMDNLINDPTFEAAGTEGAYWQNQSWGAINPTGARNGGPALEITNTAAHNFVYNLPLDNAKTEAGNSYRVSCWIYSSVAITAGNSRIAVRWMLSNGTTSTSTVSCPAISAATWTNYGGIVTAPTNAVSFSLYVDTQIGHSTGTTKWDYVSMTRASTGSLIVDGAIDGKVITGALIRTASSGARLEISNDISGGLMQFFTGDASETAPGYMNPGLSSGSTPTPYKRPTVIMSSGRLNGQSASYLQLLGTKDIGGVGNGSRMIYNAAYHDMSGDLALLSGGITTQTHVRVGSSGTMLGIIYMDTNHTLNTNASGLDTVTHNLNLYTDDYIVLYISQNNGSQRVFTTTERNANSFQVRVENAGGNPVNTAVTIGYLIVGPE